LLPAHIHLDLIIYRSLATSSEPLDMVQTTLLQTSEDSHSEPKPIRHSQVYVALLDDHIQTHSLGLFHELPSQLPFVLIEVILSIYHLVQILIPLRV
jgi:hypothetical protein